MYCLLLPGTAQRHADLCVLAVQPIRDCPVGVNLVDNRICIHRLLISVQDNFVPPAHLQKECLNTWALQHLAAAVHSEPSTRCATHIDHGLIPNRKQHGSAQNQVVAAHTHVAAATVAITTAAAAPAAATALQSDGPVTEIWCCASYLLLLLLLLGNIVPLHYCMTLQMLHQYSRPRNPGSNQQPITNKSRPRQVRPDDVPC
jgi:hypothetical protein